MTRECDGLSRAAVHNDCPLQCWRRRDDAPDNSSSSQTWARDHVDWAGLPVNLDLAFSPQHRDKVYAQHMMRKRGAQLWRWLPRTAALCVCEASAERLDTSAAKDYV
ncbi:hypothetical protein [Mycobacterium sp. 1164966.3]|uniref:hypothetical protein n=1 Tax=Mycobacterium sp. 1164966.3 TaxID=1856861 RepID=UPI000B2D657B|nr:hypothetical protein [Mycobacterium sp. 1164966.3]